MNFDRNHITIKPLPCYYPILSGQEIKNSNIVGRILKTMVILTKKKYFRGKIIANIIKAKLNVETRPF